MKQQKIILAHGAGGKMSHELIEEFFLPFLKNEILCALDDSAVIPAGECRLPRAGCKASA